MTTQLSLPVQLPDEETFSTFISGDNSILLAHLNQLLQTTSCYSITYVNAESGAGKSHLMYALCAAADESGQWASYINLQDSSQWQPEMLQGLEACQIVCLDNVEALLGRVDWQVALFDLINRVIESGTGHLVFSANVGASVIELELPDLKSRLVWGTSFKLHGLDDQQCIDMLRQRASLRGMHLSEEVGQYLLNRSQRDTHSLIEVLNKLDKVSLQQQRRLTIPFVKQALSL
ncbi:DnaA regulatory inactivator Hda [Alteromonadaceae bacterium BrNp21-10]|nr:DnaA regulatory inactivator Hda [Alteromonadaceae bacterium BrNp21-10]